MEPDITMDESSKTESSKQESTQSGMSISANIV